MKLKIFCIALVAVICARADIAISPSSIDYAVGGGGAAVKTSGSGTWTATSDVDWITLVKSSGDAGASCTYIVSRNNSADVREGHITISGNIYTVTQKGCPITLTPSSISVDKAGSSGKITASVDAGVTWTATPSDTWITISPTAGSGAAELSYTVAEYNVVGSRIGTIRIGSEKFTVTQTGIDVTLSPVSTNITKDVCIVPLQVVALTETKWTVTPNVSWISVLDGGNGCGGSQVTLAVAENPSFEKRVGTVTIGTAVFTVTQSGTDDVNFKILPEVATASPKGAFANVAVYATPDATWSAESQDSWIKITEGESGAGNGNVKYVTMSNPELEPRTGHIKFTPPIYTPELDLYSGLLFWIKDQTNIEGNETRRTSISLNTELDGTRSISLSGTALPTKDNSDFACAFSFKIGELDRINRLFVVGKRNFYLDSDNYLHYDFQGDQLYSKKLEWKPNANTWYTIVLSHKVGAASSGIFSIYLGIKDKMLSLISAQSEGAMFDFSHNVELSNCVRFGQTDLPSSGYLQDGQFANLRFWVRALTDQECESVDTKQYVMLEKSPQGAPVGVGFSHFPLNGNMHGSDGVQISPFGKSYNITSSGWIASAGRQKTQMRAIKGSNTSTIKISQFSKLFGDYLINNGGEFPTVYARRVNTSVNGFGTVFASNWYPYDPTAVGDVYYDATYSFWIKVNALPQTDVNIFARDRSNAGTTDDELKLSITSNGRFKLSGTGMSTAVFGNVVIGEWQMVTLSSISKTSITAYVNGEDCGNFASGMTLGFLLPIDTRVRSGSENPYSSMGAWTYQTTGSVFYDSLTIGGWNGVIDEMTFFTRALTAKEVRAIYVEGGRSEDVLHTVQQGIQEPSISPESVSISKFGGTTNISLSVARAINWSAAANDDWLSIVGDTSGTGPAAVMVKAEANPTCLPRTGTATIGTKTLTIHQAALDCAVTANKTIFPTEADETGGMGIISVTPEGNGLWTAESDVSWIYCYPKSGTGSYDVYFFVEDMGSTAACRSGKITIGGQTIEITQRGYELSIDPKIGEVGGNAGAGVIGVAADDGAIWTAIADVPWISIVKTTDEFVHYTFTDNTTGETRIGHINISGSTYTLTQTCKLDLNATVVGKGTITGGGKYAQGANVTLTATPATGYEFSHWSGDVVGVDAQTSVIMDSVKNVTATFIPEAAAQVLAEKKAAQGGFYTRDQIHNLEMGNLVLDVDATTGKARIGVQLQETSDLSNPNWQPVNVTTGDLDIGADGTVGIKASATGNAKFFRVVTPER